MAIKVKLRQKNISKGRKSLYLDFYPAITHPETAEETRREFINLYLFLDKKEQKEIIDKLKTTINERILYNKDCTFQKKELEYKSRTI